MTLRWKDFLLRLLKDEQGATMVEYALMLGLIMLVCIAAVGFLGLSASNLFTANGNALPNALGS